MNPSKRFAPATLPNHRSSSPTQRRLLTVVGALVLSLTTGVVGAQQDLVPLRVTTLDQRSALKTGHAVRQDVSAKLQEMALSYPGPATLDDARRGPKMDVLNKFAPQILRDRIGTPFDSSKMRDQTSVEDGSRAPAQIQSLIGYSNLENVTIGAGTTNPSDVNGAVGRDYYVQFANVGLIIIDKSTLQVSGPFPGNALWDGFGGPCQTENAGDPIVLYDHLAQRWVYSQFTGSTVPRQCFAVSQTSSPFGPFNRYEFNYSEGNAVFNDYGKIGLWTDPTGKRSGYYMTSNDFASNQFRNMSFLVFERDQMLAGAPQGQTGFVQWQWFPSAAASFFGAQPPNLEGNTLPPNNACAFFTQQWDDETFSNNPNPSQDGYVFWEVCVDWDADTFVSSDPYLVPVNVEWDSAYCLMGACLPQPGTAQGLDALSQFTMYRTNVRAVGNNWRSLVTHNTDTAAGGIRSGVHWTQLDLSAALASPGSPGGNPGPLPQVLQTSTYAPGSVHRAFGTGTHDAAGNFALSYTATSSSVSPGIRVTGQEVGDPANTLQAEAACVDGGGSQTGSNRWQDYASMSIDPVDQCTFWSTHQYMAINDPVVWSTRICAFRFPSCSGGSGDLIFEDGFASGNTSAWSSTVP